MRIFASAPYVIYLVTSFATVGLVYVNQQPEYEPPISIRFRQFQKFGKFELGALSFPATPKKKNLYGV